MSTADAERLGVSNGDTLSISNDGGSIEARVVVSDDIAAGVVCLHEGAWLEPGPDGVDRGGCANTLTSTVGSGPATAPVMHGLPVRVKKAPLALDSFD